MSTVDAQGKTKPRAATGLRADAHILAMRHICKQYPGVVALDDVNLALLPGEIRGLIGENGAGKSTLMKVLSGVIEPSAGHVFFRGEPAHSRWRNVAQAQRAGIVMIHQELNLVDDLSVADNIFLGQEQTLGGLVRTRRQRTQATALLQRLRAQVDPRDRVADISLAQKQLVEIAKALAHNARILIMDEPTAVLSGHEIHALFDLMAQLRKEGVTILYISHILSEVLAVCDRITVMRDGKIVRTLGRAKVNQVTESQLASMMVGRPMSDYFPPRESHPPTVLMSIRGLCSGKHVQDVSLNICCGEILGLAGLVGAGRTELGETIAGLRRRDAGTMEMEGEELKISAPADAVAQGIAYLSEDRKGCGLALGMSTSDNIVMVSLKRYSLLGLLLVDKQRRATQRYIEQLKIKVADADDPVSELSGGNQQKVALAKWLETHPKVLILDEPTRGVDIGAKEEIYRLIRSLARTGMACLLISSEFNELLGMCHRIGVMRQGRLVGMVGMVAGDGETATEETLMHLAAGIVKR